MARELISQRINIGRRYIRAVDIQRDLEDPKALDGYVVTSTVRDALRRILDGLRPESTQRAFRVTGPFGSGKSSFGLLLAQLFREGADGGTASDLVASAVGDLQVPPYRSLLISGRSASLTADIAKSLHQVVRSEFGSRHEVTRAALQATEKHASAEISDSQIVLDCMIRCSDVFHAEYGCGLLLLIDEMGRYVEYAVANPHREDVSVFQQLAEVAGGSRKAGIGVVGFLHQRFDDYVTTLGDWVEGEWRRSSERYEEIAFHESDEQMLFLLSEALVVTRSHIPILRKEAKSLYREAATRGLFTMPRNDLADLGERLYPFHPGALACLGTFSRRFGQNERSVFAFLQSSEPFGYQGFSHRTNYASKSWYRIPDVFDYLASQGTLRFRSRDREKRWEIAQDALLICSDLSDTTLSVFKAISLIGLLEPLPGLSADVDSLAWLLGYEKRSVRTSLDELVRRRAIHKRETQEDWSLWSNSSIDLNQWLDKAKEAIPDMTRLDVELSSSTSPRPMVAQRHFHRTGNLRSFAVQFNEDLSKLAFRNDGLIVIHPTYPDQDQKQVRLNAIEISKQLGGLALLRIQAISPGHLAIAQELKSWQWIKANCEELRIDDLAREEVERKTRELENRIRINLFPFEQANLVDNGSEWIRDGEAIRIDSREELSRYLSDICDQVFSQSPVLRNELINRDKLSTAIAAARMRLLGLMLDREADEFLGLTGAPPERTIYLAMFHESGMHRVIGGRLQFCNPGRHDPRGWEPAWRLVDSLIRSGESVDIDVVIEKLGEPPIGLRAAPSLLLVTAYMLRHSDTVALMERGSFQPEVSKAHFLRLAKSPRNFSLRRVDTVKNEEVLASVVKRLSIWHNEPPQPTVKGITESIYHWFGRLSEYARKTKTVGETAQSVRGVIAKANEPVELLLHDLPKACGAVRTGCIDIEVYTRQLDAAFMELANALPQLRVRVEKIVTQTFAAKSIGEFRERIRSDFVAESDTLNSYELRAFVDRSLNEDVDDETLIDGVAGLLIGKRLEGWDDTSADHFDFEMRSFSQKLDRRLAQIQQTRECATAVTVVHLTSSDGTERSLYLRDGLRDDASVKARMRTILSETEHPGAVLVDLIGEIMS